MDKAMDDPDGQRCWIALRGEREVAVVAASSEEEVLGVVAEHALSVDRVVPGEGAHLRPGVRISVAPDAYAGTLTGVFPPGYLDELRDEWR